jgi:hypothetical protein
VSNTERLRRRPIEAEDTERNSPREAHSSRDDSSSLHSIISHWNVSDIAFGGGGGGLVRTRETLTRRETSHKLVPETSPLPGHARANWGHRRFLASSRRADVPITIDYDKFEALIFLITKECRNHQR